MKTLLSLALVGLLAACSTDADVASRNLSQAADNFEIARRVIFYNGVTNDYMLSIEGFCSIGSYKKHMLGLSDNVTYFVEQMEPAAAGTSRYRVVFKPSVIVPDIQIK
jgi:hypothetical protein